MFHPNLNSNNNLVFNNHPSSIPYSKTYPVICKLKEKVVILRLAVWPRKRRSTYRSRNKSSVLRSSRKDVKSCSRIYFWSRAKIKLLSISRSNVRRSQRKFMRCFKFRPTISLLKLSSKNAKSCRNSTKQRSTSASARWVFLPKPVPTEFLWLKWLTKTWIRRTYRSQLKCSNPCCSLRSRLLSSAETTSRASTTTPTLSEISAPAPQRGIDRS